MRTFKIIANDVEMGAYQANSSMEAVAAYVQDAGYKSIEDAADVCKQTVEEFLGDLTVSEEESEDGYVPEVITPENYQAAKALVENTKKEESKMEKKIEVPVFESNCNTGADFYADPDTFENKNNENAEPTSRCLSGTNDFWAAEEWTEPVVAPDGRGATKYYLFAPEDVTDDDGMPLEADCYPWDGYHVSRIVID
ncbi:MAG: hypothetical protein PHN44_11850 [Candidatus Marinimicrobia bacterium]|nr:hypothetical protein [Candidatus Neomarinimicrobiota bacterium]